MLHSCILYPSFSSKTAWLSKLLYCGPKGFERKSQQKRLNSITQTDTQKTQKAKNSVNYFECNTSLFQALLQIFPNDFQCFFRCFE